jgi:hypothetical protein
MIILFLGAGASAALGYPVMDRLRTELENRIKGQNRELLEHLMHLGRVGVDAETILEDIEAFEVLDKRKLGMTFQYAQLKHDKGIKSLDFSGLVSLCHSLKVAIEESIFDVYLFRPECKRHFGLYEELFLMIHDFGQRIISVFSTNYDRNVEEFCAGISNIELRDGFVYDAKTRRHIWNPTSSFNAINHRSKRRVVRLFKLHGSLDWKKANGVAERASHETQLQPRVKDLLIYPGRKEPPVDMPFDQLYRSFEYEMMSNTVCIVIGFSFRDPYLNRIFLDFVRSGRHLIIVSKNCRSTVARNLLGLGDFKGDLEYELDRYPFHFVETHFGDEGWQKGLRDPIEVFYLEHQRYLKRRKAAQKGVKKHLAEKHK